MAESLRQLLDPGNWLGMKPALDPAASLISLDHKPSPGEVKVRIGLGLVVPALAAVVISIFGDETMVVVVAGGFAFFGLVNLFYAIILGRFEKQLVITDTQVFVKTRSLLGRKQWDEPVANYRGVLLREGHMREGTVGNIDSTRTYHIVELAHDDDAKIIPLYVVHGASPPRAIQEAFARRFGLPALAPDEGAAGGEVARAVETLDRPAAELPPPRDPGPPPSGVRLRRDGDTTRITLVSGRTGKLLATLFWLAVPLVFGAIVYQLDPLMALPAAGMVALFLLMMFGLYRIRVGKADDLASTLRIEADRIWIDHPPPAKVPMSGFAPGILGRIAGRRVELPEDWSVSLPRVAIEQIRIDRATSYANPSHATGIHRAGQPHHNIRLLIEGDESRLEFAASLFEGAKLEWVRNYLRHVLAGGG